MSNVFHDARESQLTRQQQNLLTRFGLTGNAQANRARIAPYAAEPMGTNAYRAVQLARALGSGRFGSARRGPRAKVDWKRQLGAGASKQNYDRRLAAAKAKGDAAKTAQLRAAYKARLHNTRAETVAAMAARRAKLQRIRRNTRGGAAGPRSFPVNVNFETTRKRLALALGDLVGVLQDLMAVSGASLCKAINAILKMQAGPLGATVARVGIHTAVKLTPDILMKWIAYGVLRGYGIPTDSAALGVAMQRAKAAVMAIMAGKEADLRPLVREVVMSIQAERAQELATKVVQEVLDTYVYKPYSSSTSKGDGTMCTLCRMADCGEHVMAIKYTAAYTAKYTKRLGQLLARAIRAINDLLSLGRQKLTLTQVLRQALDTYAGKATFLKFDVIPLAKRATSFVMSPLLNSFALAGKRFVDPYINRYGLEISTLALAQILWYDMATIRAFIRKDFSRPLDAVLVNIVVKAQPLGLLRGAAGALVTKGGSSQFCAMCTAAYGNCMK